MLTSHPLRGLPRNVSAGFSLLCIVSLMLEHRACSGLSSQRADARRDMEISAALLRSSSSGGRSLKSRRAPRLRFAPLGEGMVELHLLRLIKDI